MGSIGARLPSGRENVQATYRVGAGPEGDLAADRLTVPPDAVPRITSVTNPLPATGGVAAASRAGSRWRIGTSTEDLGRIVGAPTIGASRSIPPELPGRRRWRPLPQAYFRPAGGRRH